MRFLIFFLILGTLATMALTISERGCRYIMGTCVEECPEGTHAYVSNCRSPTWSERTCDEPKKKDMGAICDLSRCECDEPTVRDLKTNKCVKVEDCS